jgi:hypothetical protein
MIFFVKTSFGGHQPLTISLYSLVNTMATKDINMATPSTEAATAAAESTQDPTEVELGIATYLSPNVPGFSAVLKARYSDFVVHEGMYLFLVSSVCLQFLICILAS